MGGWWREWAKVEFIRVHVFFFGVFVLFSMLLSSCSLKSHTSIKKREQNRKSFPSSSFTHRHFVFIKPQTRDTMESQNREFRILIRAYPPRCLRVIFFFIHSHSHQTLNHSSENVCWWIVKWFHFFPIPSISFSLHFIFTYTLESSRMWKCTRVKCKLYDNQYVKWRRVRMSQHNIY